MELTSGDRVRLEPTAMAHGGEAIAHASDGRVVFVAGALPGDVVEAELTTVKKRWARAALTQVVEPSPDRTEVACPAAAAGAGCCDYSHIDPAAQTRFKREILVGQLEKHARPSGVLEGFDAAIDLEEESLEPTLGWRTRVRLGVDEQGRAGMRRARSREIVAGQPCSQVVPEALDGIVGGDARFTPGAELVVVVDGAGQRHVVETRRAQRGKRVEHIDTRIEGGDAATEIVPVAGEEFHFSFPPTAFWQAHLAAPAAYSAYILDWAADDYGERTGWDLYGGVGLFVPSISAAMEGDQAPRIVSVDYSPAATRTPQPALSAFNVDMRNQKVEAALDELPDPGLVVLDPPRTGAGENVVAGIAARRPQRVIHVGCDPATFTRDLATWGAAGYVVERMALIDAFPATHHFEVLTSLVPA
ncbi:TRAM domain-containing protein [Corynebacterium genitalium ATCC 33030]|uniref:TRAM domain protein n=1 Tax=Corynebacterium genitalium ATCC 33030 TaxID=585529 RepID=D7WCC6_9CORY|nr:MULTISPECIES: TRAM domain-containing protein [Corynebacterium]MCQ4618049.1 class I SAM-dependent RNA methyltransferase [Corynebacterium pseudogenitalium]EFK53807.1 TRAM domain protein [Corynebacterium genitalium ATCC 33030]MCQ4621666.1 class I SAM-dependent RNA methyltransferase [Corynebacterium sp. CCUG 71335]MCQ4626808.1 class I SAM-dependent RNA methyltransferase [Corynebacterium sp. CCUG 65737]UUA88633.1 TRAM domain-containing protein [Corynebacterium genitalium ATCC 33030]